MSNLFYLEHEEEIVHVEDMKRRNKKISEEINKQRDILEKKILEQEQLKEKVSSKSSENVDIKPGQTIENIYVSLRRRGKVLKGQGNPDAPVLKNDQNVLLLPERSIRILKEYLVDLQDHNIEELGKIKKDNEELKKDAHNLFTTIKEQHEKDKLLGSSTDNQMKEKLDEYEEIFQINFDLFKD